MELHSQHMVHQVIFVWMSQEQLQIHVLDADCIPNAVLNCTNVFLALLLLSQGFWQREALFLTRCRAFGTGQFRAKAFRVFSEHR